MHYSNFNGLYTSSPHNYFQPSTLNEMVHNVEESTVPTRIVGSVHTFNDISMTTNSGTIIDTSSLNKIISINQSSKTVTVQSGIKLGDLLEHLQVYGLTLPVVTATDQVSIAGAISTGAHGSNVLNGSMSSMVLHADIIAYDGKYWSISSSNDLPAFRCSLGCLGAIYSVTLRCTDLFSIKQSKLKAIWSDIAPNLDAILERYPYTQINVNQFSYPIDCTVELREKIPYNENLGAGYRVLTGNVDSWYIEIELAFPYEIISTAVKAISSFHIKYKSDRNLYSRSQLLVRFSSADNTLISMASGRKTVYISSFFGNEYDPHDIDEFMQLLSDTMVEKYGGRPHYGKEHHLSRSQMVKLYGNKYDEFLKIKNRYDPVGKFSNDYIMRIT
jgi:FAD/FMN-containing dehydrogenase